MIFDEKTSILGLLKSSSSSSYSDPFGIIEDIGSAVPFMGISTSLSTSVLGSTVSRSTLTDTFTSLDQIYQGNGTSPTPYLARWDFKTIEDIGPDVGDISTNR